MVWTAIGCLNLGVNAIVWNADAIDRAPIWCDICESSFSVQRVIITHRHTASHIIVAVAVAIPASSLCINRRLYKIACVRSVRISKAEVRRSYVAVTLRAYHVIQKRRAVLVDLAIGLGIPVAQLLFGELFSAYRLALVC